MKDGNKWYAQARRGKTTVRMHRLILPGVPNIDHVDGNGLNNRKSNLRASTHSQNKMNSGKINREGCRSQFKGLTWIEYRKQWRVRVTKNYQHYYVGYFDSDVEAAGAYDKKALELYGEFAILNFPEKMEQYV